MKEEDKYFFSNTFGLHLQIHILSNLLPQLDYFIQIIQGSLYQLYQIIIYVGLKYQLKCDENLFESNERNFKQMGQTLAKRNSFAIIKNCRKCNISEYTRMIRMSKIDFISAVGGLFGLCLGFSFVSFFEVLYWFTLVLARNLCRYLQSLQYSAGPPE